NDGKQLVPLDAPTLARYQPDWDTCLQDAINLRPELVLAREELKTRQLNLRLQQNQLHPDLRFFTTYSLVGLGNRLDGDATQLSSQGALVTTNALRSMAGSHFNDWTMGLTLNMPIGFRFENAIVRQASLVLAQSFLTLKDQENKARTFLAK